jgi:hypothetical protein
MSYLSSSVLMSLPVLGRPYIDLVVGAEAVTGGTKETGTVKKGQPCG